jgi:hypothetical protein
MLWCIFLVFIFAFGWKVPWTVRSEAQLTWTVRWKSATWMPRVPSFRHQKWYRPISAWHVADDTTWTNQVTTCQFMPRGMLSRLQNGVDQWAIDTCHMCHVAVRPTPVGTSPGVGEALLGTPFGALNRNPSTPAAWRGKSIFDVYTPCTHVKPGNTKITNLTWQTYFFTIYHSDVAGSGSVNVDRPIKIRHVSIWHVSTYSRPVRNFFFKSRILVGRPIKAR